MKTMLERVTVTGADDSVDPKDLVEISEDFPFVEWGVLLSPTRYGTPRFPSKSWMEDLLQEVINAKIERDFRTKLSGHLCGKFVRKICDGYPSFMYENTDIISLFKRMQLNFHGHPFVNNMSVSYLNELLHFFPYQWIFQIDGVNDNLLKWAVEDGVDAVGLYDRSHGAGVLPSVWPEKENYYCGYAGGLSVDNLSDELEKIYESCRGEPIWIDAETHLRSEDDSVFDLDKVCDFLRIASFWVKDTG